MSAAGFDEDGVALIAEPLHERQSIALEEGFAAGQFHGRQFLGGRGGGIGGRQGGDAVGDLRELHAVTLFEGVGGIAVGTAQIAGSETNENAGQAGEGAFALQAQVNFIDHQRVRH